MKCSTIDCERGKIITAVDTADQVGIYTSIAVDARDIPIISYHDYTNGDLKVLKCGNAHCTVGNITTTVDSAGDVGAYASIA